MAPRSATIRSHPATTDTLGRTGGYTPAQARVIELLGRRGDRPGPVPAERVAEIRRALETRIEPAAEHIPSGASLVVSKSSLSQLDECEGHWQASATTRFRWTVPAARGTVAHKAIELGLNWRGESDPGRLVDEAVQRLAEGESPLAVFLRSLSTVEQAELRREAVAFVTVFEESVPPLKSRWRPVVDGPSRVPLLGGRVVLVGRPDLTLGRAAGGGKVIIDLKTGAPRPHHRDDLAFYALTDALRVGIAPRRIATLYLDAGLPDAESVTDELLTVAAERVAGAAEAMIAIRTGRRPAALHPQPTCAWCPARAACEPGAAWVDARARGDFDGTPTFWWTDHAA